MLEWWGNQDSRFILGVVDDGLPIRIAYELLHETIEQFCSFPSTPRLSLVPRPLPPEEGEWPGNEANLD